VIQKEERGVLGVRGLRTRELKINFIKGRSFIQYILYASNVSKVNSKTFVKKMHLNHLSQLKCMQVSTCSI